MSIGYLFSSTGVSRIMTNKMEFIVRQTYGRCGPQATFDGVTLRQHTKLGYIKYLFNHFVLHLVC